MSGLFKQVLIFSKLRNHALVTFIDVFNALQMYDHNLTKKILTMNSTQISDVFKDFIYSDSLLQYAKSFSKTRCQKTKDFTQLTKTDLKISKTYLDVVAERLFEQYKKHPSTNEIPALFSLDFYNDAVSMPANTATVLKNEALSVKVKSRKETPGLTEASNILINLCRAKSDLSFLDIDHKTFFTLNNVQGLKNTQSTLLQYLQQKNQNIIFDSDPTLYLFEDLPILYPESFDLWYPIPSHLESYLILSKNKTSIINSERYTNEGSQEYKRNMQKELNLLLEI